MKTLLKLSCLSVLAGSFFVSTHQAQRLELHEVWSLSPGDREYITTGDRERGLAVHPAEGYVVVVQRRAPVSGVATPPIVAVLDGTTGEEIGRLSTEGVEVGHVNDFLLNKIVIADDGAIYACNLAVNTATLNNFRVYRWADRHSDPVLVFDEALNAEDPVANNRRFGDSIAVRGTGENTELLFSTWFGSVWARMTPQAGNPDQLEAQVFERTNIDAGEVRDLDFGPDNLVYSSRPTRDLYEIDYQAGIPSAEPVRRFDASSIPHGIGPVGVDSSNGLLGGVDIQTHRFYLFDLDDLDPGITVPPVATRLFPTLNTNGNGTGAVAFGNGLIYALDTNNGIMAMQLVEVEDAPVQAGEVLWTNANAIAGVQRDGDNLREHATSFTRAIGIAVDAAAEHVYFVDNVPGDLGVIGRVDFDGQNRVDLVEFRSGPQFVALTADRIYWTEFTTGVWSVDRAGSEMPSHVIDSAVHGLTQTAGILIDEDAGHLYLATAAADARLFRANLDGSDFQHLDHIQLEPATYGLALDRANGVLYTSNYDAAGKILSHDLDTGADEVLYENRRFPLGIAVNENGTGLFWAERNMTGADEPTSGRILSAPAAAGGQVRPIAINLNSPFGLTLVPMAGEVFSDWISQFDLPAEQAGPGDDPEGDGIENVMEFALQGGDPTVADRAILPAIGFETVGDDDYLSLAVSKNPAATGITYIVEVISDLHEQWLSGPQHTTVVEETESLLIVRDNTPISANDRRVIRLRVELE